MSSKTLCVLMRAAVIAVAICGVVACCFVLPAIGTDIANNNPEFSHCYYPWLVFFWVASLPCFAVLVLLWKISTAVKQEQVFTLQTARMVKASAMLLFGDTGFFFTGNVVFAILGMSHLSVLLVSLFADVFAVALAVIAAVLSRYLTKAADLQEEADGTI